MSKNLNIVLKQSGKGRENKEIIQLEGDLTINNVPKIQEVMLFALDKSKSLDINLKKVDNIDLACMQLLYSFCKTSVSEGRAISVNMELLDDIRMIVENSGLDKVFKIHIDRIEKEIAEEKIAASLKEKEILLKELHHRVKNNLQIISGLLYMQLKKVKGKKNIELFQQSQDRIKAIAMVHESFYNDENLVEINFAHFVKTQISHLPYAYDINDNNLKFNIQIDDIYLNIDMAIPMALIVNELIMNSLKHAFPDNRKGVIDIKLEKHNNYVLVSFKDNGIGLPDDFNIMKTDSFGLELVSKLTEQLEGELTINKRNNSGTEIQIRFSFKG